ncbi:hypothetical protein Lser_V15G33372 [Lactuca serriola]
MKICSGMENTVDGVHFFRKRDLTIEVQMMISKMSADPRNKKIVATAVWTGILHLVLERVVACGPVKVTDSLTGLIKNSEMKWIVLHGKDVSDENKVLLSQAVDIFNKSKVVTNGMFRIFGVDVAKLPIVATSETNKGKGYFQLSSNALRKLLAYLKVNKMVVPAAEDVESM